MQLGTQLEGREEVSLKVEKMQVVPLNRAALTRVPCVPHCVCLTVCVHAGLTALLCDHVGTLL